MIYNNNIFLKNFLIQTVESLQETLCHEIGHSLNLDHPIPANPNALMNAETNRRPTNVSLDIDDINGIQALYGTFNGLVSSDSEAYKYV